MRGSYFVAMGLALALFLSAPFTAKAQVSDKERLVLLKTFREEFILIEPGKGDFPAKYKMGRDNGPELEGPTIEIEIGIPFHIAKYEVPQNLWEAVMGSNPSKWKGPRNSVEMIDYNDAVAFCEKATTLMREAKLIEPNEAIRLPREWEWEYAARAGSTTLYCFGDDVKELDAYAWHHGNAAGNDPPVGAKKPNKWGLYDMHGYLWEWCWSPWLGAHNAEPRDFDGEEPARVLRGGSWKDNPDQLTSTVRKKGLEALKDDAVGLRCVLSEAIE